MPSLVVKCCRAKRGRKNRHVNFLVKKVLRNMHTPKISYHSKRGYVKAEGMQNGLLTETRLGENGCEYVQVNATSVVPAV